MSSEKNNKTKAGQTRARKAADVAKPAAPTAAGTTVRRNGANGSGLRNRRAAASSPPSAIADDIQNDGAISSSDAAEAPTGGPLGPGSTAGQDGHDAGSDLNAPSTAAADTAIATAPNSSGGTHEPLAPTNTSSPSLIGKDGNARPRSGEGARSVSSALDTAPENQPERALHEGSHALGERALAFGGAVRDRLRTTTPEQWLWIAVLTLAGVLRFWGLGDKPLHHDESMHAYFSLAFAEDPSSYSYNPLLHGPFQFHAEGIMFALIMALQNIFVHGASGNPWINDTTARFLPALFGLGIAALPLGLRRELGRVGALVAAFLLAVSPTFVYFSRFLREDIYFNFFMFAMVVCAVRFAHSRQTRWFVGLFAATILAYTTFEGIFLTLAVFIGFLALLAVWELAHGVADRLPRSFSARERVLFSRAGLIFLLGGVAALAAKVGLQKLNEVSTYISNPANKTVSDTQVQILEDRSVAVLLFVSIAVALLVIGTLLWQMYRDDLIYGRPEDYDAFADEETYHATLRARYRASRAAKLDRAFTAPARAIVRLRNRLDPERQSFLAMLLGVSWVQWFVAFVVAWLLFAALFWIIPGPGSGEVNTIGAGFQHGVGLGLWQGLYYWLQQQNIARGGQPWYYYLLVLPLYEQLACVFGVAGVVYSLRRPTRFRMFLVFWFAGSLLLYSWAGEKMPWLTIQILLPLLLLAAIAIAPLLEGCLRVIELLARSEYAALRAAPWRPAVSVLGTALALLLLVPMLFGTLTLSQVDAANAPHEMLVYVQTTPDVQRVMNKIEAADTLLYGGRHQLRIGVGTGMEWPFYWYLRDYTNKYFGYQPDAQNSPKVDVMLLAEWEADGQTYLSSPPAGWEVHQYKLRWWWDEGYKPKPCVQTAKQSCQQSDFLLYGIGLGPYLSYGQPAQHGQPDFNLGKASNRLWRWLWLRAPLGSTDGSTDFVFVVHDGLPIKAFP